MIPDYQTLMLPVLRAAAEGERSIADTVEELALEFGLSPEERAELLPSGKQARFDNRVHWARSYLKQAGLLENTRRGHFKITQTGADVLKSGVEEISAKYLEQFPDFIEFRNRTNTTNAASEVDRDNSTTPDELLRQAHAEVTRALVDDLLDRLIQSEPAFFEDVIVRLLVSMGYGASTEAGTVLGRSGDDGVDGVINQDPLGVDQVYVQAKRYKRENKIGSGAIRDFYGALGLKDVTKGIFVTTSDFSSNAKATSEKLNARMVLIDGVQLARLMIAHEVGCRVERTYKISVIEESFFE